MLLTSSQVSVILTTTIVLCSLLIFTTGCILQLKTLRGLQEIVLPTARQLSLSTSGTLDDLVNTQIWDVRMPEHDYVSYDEEDDLLEEIESNQIVLEEVRRLKEKGNAESNGFKTEDQLRKERESREFSDDIGYVEKFGSDQKRTDGSQDDSGEMEDLECENCTPWRAPVS